MRTLTRSEISRFVSIVFAVLAVSIVIRAILFGYDEAEIGGGDMVIAIAVATAMVGGWLKREAEK